MILEATSEIESDPPMLLAKRASKKSEMRFQLGAVVVKKGKVLAVAHNVYKTHPKFGAGKYNYLHAEGHAIYRAIINGHDVSGSTLYVYRKNGLNCRPCAECEKLMREHGIKKVVYTNEPV